uniref:Uncharacterized protein n=1 Tax=Arundo donax TaxID=35708 RepID=A0A0A9BD10_ARUDO
MATKECSRLVGKDDQGLESSVRLSHSQRKRRASPWS